MPGFPQAPRILVIRGGAIGDFILTLPAIRLLRENFPQAQLEILGYKHIIALALERYYAEATRSIEYAALSGFFVPNGGLAEDLVKYFAGFQQIVSYLYDPDGFFEANVRRCGVKHFLNASPMVDGTAHAAFQLARPLQGMALYLEDHSAILHPSAADRKFSAQFLSGCHDPLIAVHPGSGSSLKNWPVQFWREFGLRLAATAMRPSILLIGGEADLENTAILKEAWRELPVQTAMNLPLTDLAAVIERCAGFVGHDSGISHIAAAVGTPSLLLFGPTNPRVWAPANPNAKILQASGNALENLAVETVLQAAVEMLQPRA